MLRDQEYFKRIGALGGKAKVKKGFAKMDKKRFKQVTSKGGKVKANAPTKEDLRPM